MQGLLRLAGWGAAATGCRCCCVVIAANSSTRARAAVESPLAAVNGNPGSAKPRRRRPHKRPSSPGWPPTRATPPPDRDRALPRRRSRTAAGARRRARAQPGRRHRLDPETGGRNTARRAQPTATPAAAAAAAAEPPPKTAAAPPQTVPAEPAQASPRRSTTGAAERGKPPAAHPASRQHAELEAIRPRAAGVDIGGATISMACATLWNTISGQRTTTCSKACIRSWPCARTASRAPPSCGWSPGRSPTSRPPAGSARRSPPPSAICRLVTFEGQPLALSGAEPPRRPAGQGPAAGADDRALSADCPIGAARRHSRRRCKRPSFRPRGKPTGS